MNVRLELDASAVNAQLAQMQTKLSDIKSILRQAAGVMRADVLAQFKKGGDPTWKPDAPSTVKGKSYAGYVRLSRKGLEVQTLVQNGNFNPGNVLIRTGALLASWTKENDPHSETEITDASVSIGSNLKYAPYHQSDGPRKKLPRRAVRVTDDAKEKIAALISAAVN